MVIEITPQAFGFSCAILHKMWTRVRFFGFWFPILLSGFSDRSVTSGLIVVSVHIGYSEFIVAIIIIRYRHLGWFVGNNVRSLVRPSCSSYVITFVRKYVLTLECSNIGTLVRYNDGMNIMMVWLFSLLIDCFTGLSFYQLMGLWVDLSSYCLVGWFCD